MFNAFGRPNAMWKLGVIVAGLLLATIFLVPIPFSPAATQNPDPTMDCSFLIFANVTAGTVSAKNCQTGLIAFSNSTANASTVFQSVFSNDYSAGNTIRIAKGIFTMNNDLTLPAANLRITGSGKPTNEYNPADGTVIKLNGHKLSDNGVTWAELSLQNLAISTGGTLTSGNKVNMPVTVLHCDAVMWRFDTVVSNGVTIVNLGGPGPIGQQSKWHDVDIVDARSGTGDFSNLFNTWYEGFIFNGGTYIDNLGFTSDHIVRFWNFRGNTHTDWENFHVFIGGDGWSGGHATTDVWMLVTGLQTMHLKEVEFPAMTYFNSTSSSHINHSPSGTNTRIEFDGPRMNEAGELFYPRIGNYGTWQVVFSGPHPFENYLAIGKVTTVGATNTTLTDVKASWGTNGFKDFTVRILYGNGAGQAKTISSNTGTVLTVSSNFSPKPDTSSTYAIENVAAGSVGGSITVIQPLIDTMHKEVLVYLNSFNDTGQTVNFPVPFTVAPRIVANATSASVNTTQLTISSTGGAKTGWIIIEGY